MEPNKSQNDFLENLYLDPIKSLTLQKKTFRKFRIKEPTKEEEESTKISVTEIDKKTTNQSAALGNVIMQN